MASIVLGDCININNTFMEHVKEAEATARIHKGYPWYLAEYCSVKAFQSCSLLITKILLMQYDAGSIKNVISIILIHHGHPIRFQSHQFAAVHCCDQETHFFFYSW